MSDSGAMTAVNALTADVFVATFDFLFEHSPWVVERAERARPFANIEAMLNAFAEVLSNASDDERLALLCSHPELAGKEAIERNLTASSTAEQASAGLDKLSDDEFAAFQRLNTDYRTQFGFPFIICVRKHTKASILSAMEARLQSDRDTELSTALAEVLDIVEIRLRDALAGDAPNPPFAAFEGRVREDLDSLNLNTDSWVRPRSGVYDVVIVGGGQSGLGAAFGLRMEGVRNVLIVDENPKGLEGPWDTYARMITLRTPKELTSIDLGVPSLTFRAWWTAQHGHASWEAIDKIPRQDWMDYLRWYRDILDLPVQNDTRVTHITPPNNDVFTLSVKRHGAQEKLRARKVILATGIQGGGEWHTPDFIKDALPRDRYAHTSEAIDYEAMTSKRIAILGGGASAFDNAQHALHAGVRAAHVFIRKPKLPQVNVIRFMEQTGVTPRYSRLEDATKYKILSSFMHRNQPPTNDTFNRASALPGFALHAGAPWDSVRMVGDEVEIATPKGMFRYDFLVLSTGLVTDSTLRPELRDMADAIAVWGDRYQAPADIANPVLDAHPYLSESFAFQPKTPADALKLYGLFCFNFGALMSHSLSAAALSGLGYAIPKLAQGVADQLFADDLPQWMEDYMAYDEPEFVGEWPDSAQTDEKAKAQ